VALIIPDMPHVFISYVRENGDVVDRLASELASRGVKVWLDRNDLEPGARWREAIRNAIRGGKFFLACFSREFNERDKSYMNEELTLAIDELRERPFTRTWFVPVLINETAIPSRRISSLEDLSDIQALRLYENWSAGVERILRVMKYDDPVSARTYSLIDALLRPFHQERLFALKQLGTIGPAAAEAVPAIVVALKDQDRDVRGAAADALNEIGPAAAGAVSALVVALKDPDEGVRRYAAVAINKIGPAAAEGVSALVEALRDQNPTARRDVAFGLRGIGSAAAEAVPALVAALEDQDDEFRRDAVDALGGIGPPAVPALVVALKDQDSYVRRIAAIALGRIGPGAAGAVSALVEALKDRDEGVRGHAAVALNKIDPAAAEAVSAPLEALRDQNPTARRSAAETLESRRQKS
jgi:HEAT repeat protein